MKDRPGVSTLGPNNKLKDIQTLEDNVASFELQEKKLIDILVTISHYLCKLKACS